MVGRMRNRVATWLNLVFASIIVIGVFVQAYLIASYAMGAGESALDAHGFVGGLVIHASELLVFITALVAFWGWWRWILVNLGLFVLGTVQIFLLPPDEDPGSAMGARLARPVRAVRARVRRVHRETRP